MNVDVIELGEHWSAPRPEPEGTPLLRYRRPVLLALALVLTGTTAAAALPQRRVAALGDYRISGVTRSESRAVVLDDLLVAQGADTLAAFSPGDGTRLWQVPYRSSVPGAAQFDVRDGVLLVSEVGTATDVRDRATGALLWQAPHPPAVVGGLGVVVSSDPLVVDGDGRAVSGAEPNAAEEATGHDLRTGRLLWRVPGAPFAALDSVRGEVWSVDPSGVFTVHAVRDGRAVRTGELAFPPGTPADVAADPDRIELSSVGADGMVRQLGYDPATLRPLGPVSSPAAVTMPNVYRCGQVQCVTEAEGGGFRISIQDPATAAVSYRFDPNVNPVPVGGGFVTVDLRSLPGRLGSAARDLVDQASGRRMQDLRGWDVLSSSYDQDGRVLLLREVGHATQVARIDGGAVTVLGELPYRVRWCAYRPGRLSCLYDRDRLGIWRVED
ncbi:hypothetical protein Cs7R123_69740 [Catellatospora sp. TT07R-123]|uniref:PQQ-binding-like beta-propeller repeat protein n=1 Tax=Catellatospora sp. TT07R-123 TaxID=2733863 RepID=UPI001AFE5C95|nr:PQQ-binding-like beta-propeller repeat protein [Catellatospora sp. TT07R-123]GHJ49632.1 hypothetical protein Cs7R123_69740 [Catellatospora sp. TT07R-123]